MITTGYKGGVIDASSASHTASLSRHGATLLVLLSQYDATRDNIYSRFILLATLCLLLDHMYTSSLDHTYTSSLDRSYVHLLTR